MKMTNRIPRSWKELQDFVTLYFNDSGYEAVTPYKVNTVRGSVEVDVFVKAKSELGDTIICECKYWNTNIPQEKIHAFRTVIVDSGVSAGFIISKRGFQTGAIIAASTSNIKLFTWEEFLNLLFYKWFAFRKQCLLLIAQPLAVYTDFLDVPTEKFTKDQTKEYKNSLNKYLPLYMHKAAL